MSDTHCSKTRKPFALILGVSTYRQMIGLTKRSRGTHFIKHVHANGIIGHGASTVSSQRILGAQNITISCNVAQ